MDEQIDQLLVDWNLPPFLWNLLLLGVAIVIGLILKYIFQAFVHRQTKKNQSYSFIRTIINNLGKPLNYFLPLFVFNILVPFMVLPPIYLHRVSRAVEIGLIITFAWLLISSIHVVQAFIYHRYDLKKENNLRERKIRTQLLYIRQVITGLIILLTIAAVLLTFSSMRKIGAGLLTGVGIGGIFIGFAAQKSLSNLLAGFQIAFTQPMRIDDVLVVEGEWGRVEEITLTYVVLSIWDQRRLILPITYFIEKPFQNWTRNSAELLGTVFIYADYTFPVEALREEHTRLLKNNPLWDGRVNAVQVTDITESTMQIRALMSAQTSGQTFDLRCFIRENLLKFIKENYPHHLPKTRAELNTFDKDAPVFKQDTLPLPLENGNA